MSFLDELRDQFERESAGFEAGASQKYVRMPKGRGSLTIRLLAPAKPGEFGNEQNPFFHKSRVHKINGMWLHDPREEDPTNPRRLVGENAIAEYLRWLWAESERRSGEEKNAMQDRYRALKPKKYYYFNCIVREIRDEDGTVHQNVGPLVLRCGEQLFQQIRVPIFGDAKLSIPALGDVTNVNTGRDFRIIQDMARSGQREYPSYHKSVYLDPSPLGTPEQIAHWQANLHNLIAERQPSPPEVLKEQLEIFLGTKKPANAGFDPSELGMDADVAAGLKSNPASASVSALPPTPATTPVAETAPAPVTPVAPATPVAATPTPVTPVAATPTPGAETPVAPVTPVAATPTPGAEAPVAATPTPGAEAPVAATPTPGAEAPGTATPTPGAPTPGMQTENMIGTDDFFNALQNLGSK